MLTMAEMTRVGRKPMSLFKRKKNEEVVATGRQRSVRSSSLDRSQVFSYYGSRSQTDLNVGREARADQVVQRRMPGRLHKLRTHAGWAIGMVIILIAVIYQLQLSTTPRVLSLVAAEDAPYLRETDVYRQAAIKLIGTSPANRNKLTINARAISNGLKQQFPELETATVSLPMFGDMMTIYVKPADPALVLATPRDSFIIDKRGRALQRVGSGGSSLNSSSKIKIPTVTDESNLTFEPGKPALSHRTTDFIVSVAKQYQAQKTAVQAMVLPSGTSELHVYPTGKPYFVKFNLHDASDDTARMQAGAYVAVTRYLAGKNITPAQYIDVRLQGRVYYK